MQLNNLNTKFLGRYLIYYSKIDSTQSEVWRQYEKEAQTGTLVIADIQTAGKGTHGRTWHTDETGNIAFSFLIKTDCKIKNLDNLTIDIAKTIVATLEELYKIKIKIKEPNDLVFNDKKIGGILTESKIICEKVKCIVIGIGINTKQEDFAQEIANVATSIKKEFNIDVDREKFIEEFCNKFEKILIERKII